MIERVKPVVAGLGADGELVWEHAPMPRWEMEMFKKHYKGDFGEQWMWLIACQEGWFWDDDLDG